MQETTLRVLIEAVAMSDALTVHRMLSAHPDHTRVAPEGDGGDGREGGGDGGEGGGDCGSAIGAAWRGRVGGSQFAAAWREIINRKVQSRHGPDSTPLLQASRG